MYWWSRLTPAIPGRLKWMVVGLVSTDWGSGNDCTQITSPSQGKLAPPAVSLLIQTIVRWSGLTSKLDPPRSRTVTVDV